MSDPIATQTKGQSNETLEVRLNLLKESLDDHRDLSKDRHTEIVGAIKMLSETVSAIDKRTSNFETKGTVVATIFAFFGSTLVGMFLNK